MRLKPRFHTLFFIYLIFGGIIIALFIYAFSYRIGKETELNFLQIVNAEINDTILNIIELPPTDFAYPHAGGINYLELRKDKFKIPLYLETYTNENKIHIGDQITKDRNSRTIEIYGEKGQFTIILENLVELRKQKGKSEGLKWITVYLIIGVIMLFVPIQSTNRMK
jgi:hypothetical protein